MKKRKKISIIIIGVFVAIIQFFTACSVDTVSISTDTTIVESSDKMVIIEAGETGGSLEETMKALSQAGKLTYEGLDGEYGFYLTSVNGYSPNESLNEYWAIYTTLDEYDGVTYSNPEYGTYSYGSRTCASASYGISGLVMVKGEIYILIIESY